MLHVSIFSATSFVAKKIVVSNRPMYHHLPYKTLKLCNIYNMSGHVVSDIQARAEDEILYIRYNTDANVVNIACDPNACKRSYSLKILKILNDFGWENGTKSFCKSGGFCITYTTSVMALVFWSFLCELLMSIYYVSIYRSLKNRIKKNLLWVKGQLRGSLLLIHLPIW